jgi:peptide deformylase
MAVRPIVVWPDPRLREKTRAIAEITDEVRALYRDLADTMYAYDGVGIAAVQIGVSLKMFLVDSKVAGRGEGDPVAFINPEIVSVSADKDRSEEGCLSFPGIFVPIERPRQARLRAMGIDGQMFEAEGDGLFGRCMQHELDHLTGKLMIDFVGPLKKRQIKKKLEKREAEAGGGGGHAHVHGEHCDHDHDHA